MLRSRILVNLFSSDTAQHEVGRERNEIKESEVEIGWLRKMRPAKALTGSHVGIGRGL